MAEAGRNYKKRVKAMSERAKTAPRGPGGRFASNPASKAGSRRAAATASKATAQALPIGDSVQSIDENIIDQIGIIDALIQQRKEMGYEVTELENIVLGGKDKAGVRSVIEGYKKQLDMKDPASVAAGVLFEEAARLSEESLKASQKEAAEIYKKLQFLRNVAEKTQGAQSKVVSDLSKIISPVEAQLKKRASFGEFVKEQVKDFRRRIPEKIVARIPLVGGILSQFMEQRRTAKEQLESYTEGVQQRISSAGRGGAGAGAVRGRAAKSGGSSAASIPGMLGDALSRREQEFEKRSPTAFPTASIIAIQKDVEAIRKAIAKGKLGGGGSSGSLLDGLLDNLGGKLFGRRSMLGRLFRRGKIGARRMARSLKNLGRRGLGKAKNLIGRGLKAGKGLLGRGWGAVKGLASRGMGAVGRFGSTALGAVKNVGAKLLPQAGAAGKSMLAPAASMAKSAASTVANVGSKAVGAAASAGGGFFSSLWSGAKSLAGKVGEGLSSLKGLAGGIGGLGKVVMGAIGPLLEGFFAWQDIKAIQQDPNLAPAEKKKQIGTRVGRAIGSVIGSVGASVALGPAGPLVTTALDMVGIGPGALGEWLTEQLGAEKMYDLASSIIPPLAIPEDSPQTAGAEGQMEGGAQGVITAPASANTTVGKMVNQYSAETEALKDAQTMASQATAGTATPTTNNSAVNTRISNVTNNFNDDIRIRNNESTYKTMQMSAFSL